jgi:hypothetical protein
MPLGRHPCAGIKIAKLEMKLILTIILLGYEYELVDGNGNYPKELPSQDRNDVMQVSTTRAMHFESPGIECTNSLLV